MTNVAKGIKGFVKVPLAARFSGKYNIDPVSGCWVWASVTRKGYGCLKSGKNRVSAHRVSWELHFGPIPAGLWVLHRCDNPSCVNPKHLFLGTAKDNNDDMINKGRAKCIIPGIGKMGKITDSAV